jgi:hypothetical protein
MCLGLYPVREVLVYTAAGVLEAAVTSRNRSGWSKDASSLAFLNRLGVMGREKPYGQWTKRHCVVEVEFCVELSVPLPQPYIERVPFSMMKKHQDTSRLHYF